MGDLKWLLELDSSFLVSVDHNLLSEYCLSVNVSTGHNRWYKPRPPKSGKWWSDLVPS